MALQTKTISAGCDHSYTLELRLTENSTSTADNTSAVAWALVLRAKSYHFADYRIGWSVSLAGTAVSTRAWASAPYRTIAKNSELTVADGTATIPHDADGGKSMAVAASITVSRSGYSPVAGSSGTGTVSLAGSMALTAIPRASTLAAENGALGTAQTLTVTRASDAFTHTLTYDCGSLTGQTAGLGTLAGSGDTLRCTFTPPLSLAAQNTSGSAVTVTFTLVTRSGAAEIGRVSCAAAMAIPAVVKPAATVSVAAVSDSAAVTAWGAAVKGKSRYRVTTTFIGAQGSSLRARSVRIASTGETLTASPADTKLLASTARSVTVQVQDSRGRWSDPITVEGPVIHDYADPWITACGAARCRADGTADEEGAYLSVSCSGGVYPCGGRNTGRVWVRWRPVGGAWSGWTALGEAGTSPSGSGMLNAGLSAQVTYEAQVGIWDSLNGSRTVLITVPTAAVTVSFRPGGSGVAFGQYAQRSGAADFGPWDVVGRVLGLGRAGLMLTSENADDLVTPGVCGVARNRDVAAQNGEPWPTGLPSDYAGTLRIWTANGEEKTPPAAWHYVLQQYVDIRANVFLRAGRSGAAAGSYTWDGWKQLTTT